MLDALRRFLAGRYGFDRLGQALAIGAAVFMIVSRILASSVLSALAYALLILCIYRSMSKQIAYRMSENRKFLELCYRVKAYVKRDRKYYRYFKCPKCRKVTKVPKHKGKIAITCPHCSYEFIKKT